MQKGVMRGSGSWCLWLLLTAVVVAVVEGADPMATKCSQVVQQVIPCLNFAAGKAAVPSKDCCEASSKIKETAPECLCYVIEQIHKGSSPDLKSMGIQEARLIQLPSACNIKNASISNCPKLLGLAPNSPDATIFTTNASPGNSTASTTGGTTTTTTTPTSQNDSYGTMLRPPSLMAEIMVVAFTLLLVVIPTGFVSIYSSS